MAIAFDAKSVSATGGWGTGSSATWSHTCTGSDRILFVYTFNNGNNGAPTGVTYGGVSMTRIQDQATDGGSFNQSLFYLIAPATGANNIVVTWSLGNGINNCLAASYTGAAQSGQPDSQNTGSVSSSTSLTVSTTVVATGCWLIGGWRSSGQTLASGTNGTIRQASPSSFSSQAIVDSNGTVGTGSVSQTVNVSPARNMWLITVSFAPASGGGGVVKPNFLGFGGI